MTRPAQGAYVRGQQAPPCFGERLFTIRRVARIDALIQRRKHDDPLRLASEQAPAESETRRIRLGDSGMQAFRNALLVDGSTDVRESILEDLRGYFTDQYFATVNPDDEAARERVALWCVNLLWYAYLQAEGFAYPIQVALGGAARKAPAGTARHLDFGSGVGVTSQLFHSLGYAVELADVEDGLLNFARYRLEHRNIEARYIQIGRRSLEGDSYEAITAIDSLTLVPNFQTVVREIRFATRMGGFLFANFDTRRGVSVGWDILYHDDYWLRQRLQDAGFEHELKIGGGIRRYRAVETHGVRHLVRRARDAVRFPLHRTYRAARSHLTSRGG